MNFAAANTSACLPVPLFAAAIASAWVRVKAAAGLRNHNSSVVEVRLLALCRTAFLRHHEQLAIRHAEVVGVDEALPFEIE